MEWYYFVGTVLGSSVLVAIINLATNRLQRKDTVEDRQEATAKQLSEVGGRITCLEEKVDVLSENTILVMKSTKAQAYDRIRQLGMSYIKLGKVTDEELKNLAELYTTYDALLLREGKSKDEFLGKMMNEVYKLVWKPL